MRAPISVVIPTLDAAPQLAACLAALVEGLEAGLIRELIVSDGGSGDDTTALADAWGRRWSAGQRHAAGSCGAGLLRRKGGGCWCCMQTRCCRRDGPALWPSI